MIVQGTYGSLETPCEVFVYQFGPYNWYCVEGSKNVNCTLENIRDGVNVDLLEDCDYFYWDKGIETLEELEAAVEA